MVMVLFSQSGVFVCNCVGFYYCIIMVMVLSPQCHVFVCVCVGLYYCINMVMIALSTMLSTIVINLTHHLRRKPVPLVIKVVSIGVKNTSESKPKAKHPLLGKPYAFSAGRGNNP